MGAVAREPCVVENGPATRTQDTRGFREECTMDLEMFDVLQDDERIDDVDGFVGNG